MSERQSESDRQRDRQTEKVVVATVKMLLCFSGGLLPRHSSRSCDRRLECRRLHQSGGTQRR